MRPEPAPARADYRGVKIALEAPPLQSGVVPAKKARGVAETLARWSLEPDNEGEARARAVLDALRDREEGRRVPKELDVPLDEEKGAELVVGLIRLRLRQEAYRTAT